MERVISLLGLVVMIGLAWAMSEHKKQVNLRVVCGGLLLQLVLAVFILKTSIGAAIFQSIGDFFTATLGFVDAGTSSGIWRRIRPPFLCLQSIAHHHLLFILDVNPLLPGHDSKSR